jgi:hypothetical protein
MTVRNSCSGTAKKFSKPGCPETNRKYDCLTAFQDRVTYLKNRLEALNCAPTERGCIILVITALKTTYPDWYNFLSYDFEKGDITWAKLMQDVSKRANHELTEMSLMTTKPRTSSSTPQVGYTATATKETRQR